MVWGNCFLQAADGYTTDQGVRNGAIEQSPLMGENPSTAEIAIVKFGITAAIITIVNWLPEEAHGLKKLLLSFTGGITAAAVVNNVKENKEH